MSSSYSQQRNARQEEQDMQSYSPYSNPDSADDAGRFSFWRLPSHDRDMLITPVFTSRGRECSASLASSQFGRYTQATYERFHDFRSTTAPPSQLRKSNDENRWNFQDSFKGMEYNAHGKQLKKSTHTRPLKFTWTWIPVSKAILPRSS